MGITGEVVKRVQPFRRKQTAKLLIIILHYQIGKCFGKGFFSKGLPQFASRRVPNGQLEGHRRSPPDILDEKENETRVPGAFTSKPPEPALSRIKADPTR